MGWIILGIVVVALFLIMGIYNGLVMARNGYKTAFSQIDVEMQRRHDLIPNLVETAKAYMAHEAGTLEAVIAARNGAQSALKGAQAQPGDPAAMQKLGAAEGMLGAALTKFMAVAEAYPDLKANQNMLALSQELTSTENRIAGMRTGYNDEVMSYNNKREVFPNNLIAGMFNFAEATLLQLDDPAIRQPVKVSFS